MLASLHRSARTKPSVQTLSRSWALPGADRRSTCAVSVLLFVFAVSALARSMRARYRKGHPGVRCSISASLTPFQRLDSWVRQQNPQQVKIYPAATLTSTAEVPEISHRPAAPQHNGSLSKWTRLAVRPGSP